jgi:hypothetical protein
MPDDVSTIVTGIQGREIESAAPSDGYVLTWDNADSKWKAKEIPPGQATGLRKDYFTSSGSWVAPSGVTNILVIAAGGGGGGESGTAVGGGGAGGGAAIQQTSYVSVTPGNTYTITIGTGGAGGSGVTGATPNSGSNGSSTTFKLSSTTLFSTIGGGGASSNTNYGANFAAVYPSNMAVPSSMILAGAGGVTNLNSRTTDGRPNFLDMYAGGTNGGWSNSCSSGSTNGGSGGGAGPQGNGGNGGAYNLSGNASNGGTPSANTGAGGGGGGGVCSSSGFTSGAGGSGGSGYMYIIY